LFLFGVMQLFYKLSLWLIVWFILDIMWCSAKGTPTFSICKLSLERVVKMGGIFLLLCSLLHCNMKFSCSMSQVCVDLGTGIVPDYILRAIESKWKHSLWNEKLQSFQIPLSSQWLEARRFTPNQKKFKKSTLKFLTVHGSSESCFAKILNTGTIHFF